MGIKPELTERRALLSADPWTFNPSPRLPLRHRQVPLSVFPANRRRFSETGTGRPRAKLRTSTGSNWVLTFFLGLPGGALHRAQVVHDGVPGVVAVAVPHVVAAHFGGNAVKRPNHTLYGHRARNKIIYHNKN